MCLAKGIVYKATVAASSNDDKKSYIGITEHTFKSRYNNHKMSFNHRKHAHDTVLSKYVWDLKDNNVKHSIKWSILKRSTPYEGGSTRCNLHVPGRKTIPQLLIVGTRHFSQYSSPGRRHTFWTWSEPKRLTLVSSDHKTDSQKDKGLSSWLFRNCKRACLFLGFKRGFQRGRLTCRFAWCSMCRMVAAEMLIPVVSDTTLTKSGICGTLSRILIDQSSYITCWSDC